MKTISLTLLLCLFCQNLSAKVAELYTTKFWLWPQSMQIQISSEMSKATILVYLSYDPLKKYLHEYEITRMGYDPLLSEIKTVEDFKRLKNFIDYKTVEYIKLNGQRFGGLDENFITRSVFNEPDMKTSIRLAEMSTRTQADTYLITKTLDFLFLGEDYLKATDVSPKNCSRFL